MLTCYNWRMQLRHEQVLSIGASREPDQARKLQPQPKRNFLEYIYTCLMTENVGPLYGWNSPGRTSLLDECHQNVCTLGLLTRSVLIEIAWVFLRLVRNCHWTDDIKKYQ